jgi:tRNA-Thr(GGU) m(6)t(6)A37 methyltransferase TsaA
LASFREVASCAFIIRAAAARTRAFLCSGHDPEHTVNTRGKHPAASSALRGSPTLEISTLEPAGIRNASRASYATREGGDMGAEALLRPVGVIESELKERSEAPKQESEGAPDAWLDVQAWAAPGLEGLAVDDELIIVTWLHQADREVLQVHPRGDARNPLTGVFATRSPDRPNPLGLHAVTVRAIEGNRLRIGPIEAIDGTPVVDIKPVLP